MLVRDLESSLFDRFPRSDAESWDHVGLSVGDPSAEVRGVACALDASLRSLEQAVSLGANVLLTHHPVYLSAPPSFVPPGIMSSPSASGVVFEAIRREVSIISMHTNLDRSQPARDALTRALGFSPSSSLEHPDDSSASGLGSICEVAPCSLEALAVRAERAFDTKARVWGSPEAIIRRVAVLGGSLGDFGECALRTGCDAVVTGELGYHRAQDLALRGLSVILLSHDKSEQPFCRILADASAEAGVARDHIHIITLPRQWWVPSQGGDS